MMALNTSLQRLLAGNIVLQILVGMVIGALLSLVWPAAGLNAGLLGDLFVAALKAVAPVLVLALVASSIANKQHHATSHLGRVLLLYLIGTLTAALVGVAASFLFPSMLHLVARQSGSRDRQRQLHRHFSDHGVAAPLQVAIVLLLGPG